MARLTGNIQDVTGRVPESISSVTVKAPTFRLGSDSGIVTSSPAQVVFDRSTGRIDIDGIEPGLSWLYIEGNGWSDSIALAVAEGFTTILEAVINALAETDFFKNLLKGTASINDATVLALVMRTSDSATRRELEASFTKIGHKHTAADIIDLSSFIGEQIAKLTESGGPIEAYAKTIIERDAQTAFDEAAGEIAWEKRDVLPSEDLNTLITPGLYTVPSYTRATSLGHAPQNALQTATITVTKTGEFIRQEWQKQSHVGQVQTRMWRHRGEDGVWSDWKDLFDFSAIGWEKRDVLPSEDLNTLTTPGLYTVPSYTRATSLAHAPQNALQTATITVTKTGEFIRQEWQKQSHVGQVQTRMWRHRDEAGTWSEWADLFDDGTPDTAIAGEDVFRPEVLQRVSRLRRGGVIGTNGVTPVSLSFDHGFVNFQKYILPHLIRLGLPCTVAVNADTLNVPGESAGITYAMLQEWSLNHGIEIAHHSRSHNSASGTAAIERAVLSTIDEFKSNMPEVMADAYIMPGVSGNGYDGFDGGVSTSQWYEHEAGRMILGHFPVVTSGAPGRAVPRVGHHWRSVDRMGFDYDSWGTQLRREISSLYGTHMGMSIFCHPSKVGDTLTEDGLVTMLEWLATERDAGRIEVLTISGWAWADTTLNVRTSLNPEWSGDTATIALDPLFNWAAGAQVLIETTATTTGTLTITAKSDKGGLDVTQAHDVTEGDKVRQVFTIPATATSLTLTVPGTNRTTRIV